MKQALIIIAVALVVVIGGMFLKSSGDGQALAQQCTSQGGTWLAEHNDCRWNMSDVGTGKEWCEDAGGVYNECASGCDYAPEGVSCAAVCIPSCKF